LCHVVLSCFRGEKAKGRHTKTRQMMTFSCFRMATFRLATRKYATFHALRFRLLFVVSLPGEAKGRHAKTRQNHLLAGFYWIVSLVNKTCQQLYCINVYYSYNCKRLAYIGKMCHAVNIFTRIFYILLFTST